MSQTILITGASSGIGMASATLFADRGWNVVATMRNTDDGAALADRGYRVGVMDADIWGFSVPRMLGVAGELECSLVLGDGALVQLARDLDVVSAVVDVLSRDDAVPLGTRLANRDAECLPT